MTEKEGLAFSQTPSVTSVPVAKSGEPDPEKVKDEFKERLATLPEQYREEILKQYDLPEASATLLSVFKYASWKEALLMVIGTFMAIGSGILLCCSLLISGAALPLMTVVFGNLTNVFGGFGAPGASTVQGIPTVDEFNSEVSHFALQFVYIGIGILAAAFIGTLFWTLSGERISRRIRGYCIQRQKLIISLYLQAVLRQNVAFFDRLGAGEVTNRVSNDAEMIREGISDKVLRRLCNLADYCRSL